MLNRFLAAAVLLLLLLAGAAPPAALAQSPSSVPAFSDLLVRFRPDVSRPEMKQALEARGLRSLAYDADLAVRRVGGQRGAALATALASLQADPRVLLAEPNYQIQAVGALRIDRPLLPSAAPAAPNDPLYPQQWGLQRIQAPAAWPAVPNRTITLAVIDTGLDLSHPDLRARIVPGYNFVNPGAPPQDAGVHGTHVSGIAAALQNNRLGVAGTAVHVSIMPIKVLGPNGGTIEDLAKGIRFAARHGARVLNLSLGTTTFDNRCPLVLQEAVDAAYSRRALAVAAAGNTYGAAYPFFPAACTHVLSVNSTDQWDGLSGFDNPSDWVDLAAPGEFILSTVPGGYADLSGTSMATPFVAGTAAMLIAQNPVQSPDWVEWRIELSADRAAEVGNMSGFGAGRLNAWRALSAAPPSIGH